MASFGVACLQLNLENDDNLAAIKREVMAAKSRLSWIDMVMLAELGAFGTATRHAEPLPGTTEQFFCDLAREAGVWLIPGSLFERGGDRIFNTAPVIDPSGRVVTRHRKIYPFRPYEKGVSGGDKVTVFDVPSVGRFGLSICYDMWFPETTRAMAWQGAEVILHPGLTNTIDRDVELAIARASAATNQCYFLDLNAAGNLGLGRSGFFGPGGEILHLAGPGREIIALDLDLDHVRRTRVRGWHGLGQVLKSFRDGPSEYPCYGAGRGPSPGLDALGPIEMPESRLRND